MELLALDDEPLLKAIAGRRRAELAARYEQFDHRKVPRDSAVECVCRHDRRYPRRLDGRWAPGMLNVLGGLARFDQLTSAAVVAIVGSRRATDYGMEMAKCIARGLAASGVTVASGLTDGVAVAAQAGALEVGGATTVVMGGGLDVACPARRRSLYERVTQRGCAVAELPCGSPARRWAQVASERTIAGLAELTVVVEADESPGELAGASIARALGRTVAAVPGRVTSRASCGTNALLIEGAHLVRGPDDALELLGCTDAPAAATGRAASLDPRLKGTLERVGAGEDTPDKLTREDGDAAEVLLALSELELIGLLARGDGGRYVPRESVPALHGRTGHALGSGLNTPRPPSGELLTAVSARRHKGARRRVEADPFWPFPRNP